MNDQAQQLRRLVRRKPAVERPRNQSAPRLIAVTAGKGGVGATTLAVNLAVALSASGRQVVLVDADFNRPDVGVLCRLDETYTLADVLAGRHDIHEVLERGPAGLQVLPGGWSIDEMADLSASAPARLLAACRDLGRHVEFVVLDIGSGAQRVIHDFARSVDALLMVTSPDPLAVINTYAAIKRLAADQTAAPIHSIINLGTGAQAAAEIQRRLVETCRRFLRLELIEAGYVPLDEHVAAAGKLQRAFVLDAPQREASACLTWLAEFIAAGRKNWLNPATANNR
jgi:flagellar biosynthesis protein FlhG